MKIDFILIIYLIISFKINFTYYLSLVINNLSYVHLNELNIRKSNHQDFNEQ